MSSDQDDGPDRRRAARIPINAEFALLPAATFISDLSEYGVFVHTPTPSPRGTRLRLRFTVLLDDPVIVEAEGSVVRQQYEPTAGMGIEFTDLMPEMILRINDVVSRQRPRDLGPPLVRDDDSGKLGASVLAMSTDDDPIDTAKTLRREAFGGSFRPSPSMSVADENAKTGIYQPVEDPDAEE